MRVLRRPLPRDVSRIAGVVMYSPGDDHKRVPRDRVSNLKFRRFVLDKAAGSPALQTALLDACKSDILFWVGTFVWQFNPNSLGTSSAEEGPFIPWDFQEDAVRAVLDCVAERRDLLIEKSREMGASWLCLLVLDWFYLFHPRKKFLVISRSEEAVDKPGDPDSLFWKLDHVHQHLPDWMTAGRVRRRKMTFENPLLGSYINGQASTGKAGVGGRATMMLIDEFSQIGEDYEVLHRTSDTTGCRVFSGTHLGVGTAFFELSQRVDMRKLVMHWTQHPDKVKGLYRYDFATKRAKPQDPHFVYPADFPFVLDGTPAGGPFPGLRSPWYDAQCRRKGSSRAVAMDLDIDPKGSVSQVFDPVTISDLKAAYARDPYWEGELRHDAETGRPVALLPSARGTVRLWCQLDHEGRPPKSRYAAGADVALGTGATCSCFSLVDGRKGEKVLEVSTPFLGPEAFAALCVALCRFFKDEDGTTTAFAWEAAGPGLKFGQKVWELGYREVYFKTDEFGTDKKVSDKPGWHPLPNNKRVLLQDYALALSSRRMVNRSWSALDECLAFKYGPRGEVVHPKEEATHDPTGARVNHADMAIADALAWKMAMPMGQAKAREEESRPPVGSMAWRRARHERHAELEGAY